MAETKKRQNNSIPPPMTEEEMGKLLVRDLKDSDRYRLEHLRRLGEVKRVKVNNLYGDRQRLIRKYDPLHPRVISLEERIVAVEKDILLLDNEIKGTVTGGPPVSNHLWSVKGRITWNDGEPVAQAVVNLYDKDLLFDDFLGTSETDADGNYQFIFPTEGFRDFVEARPDLYVKVVNKDGKRLYTSRKTIRYEAGREEILDIQVKKSS